MAITGLERRTSKLEDSLEHVKRQKEAEERKVWREANSERLQWEMFLRVHGPDSVEATEADIDKTDDPESKEEIKAELAYKKLAQKILLYYEDGWLVHYEKMDDTEKAFARLLEEFHIYESKETLFEQDLDQWAYKLNIKPDVPFVEAIRAIDEHIGSPDWREICYLQEHQDAMIEQAFRKEENRRARYLRYRAEHPEEAEGLSQ
jgi:hypothetical protein